MSEDNGNTEFTASVGPTGASVSGKGRKVSEIIAILSTIGVVLMAYMLHVHGVQSEKTDTAIAISIKELAKAQQDLVSAQREQTCILVLPQDKREQEFHSQFGLCKRLTR